MNSHALSTIETREYGGTRLVFHSTRVPNDLVGVSTEGVEEGCGWMGSNHVGSNGNCAVVYESV